MNSKFFLEGIFFSKWFSTLQWIMKQKRLDLNTNCEILKNILWFFPLELQRLKKTQFKADLKTIFKFISMKVQHTHSVVKMKKKSDSKTRYENWLQLHAVYWSTLSYQYGSIYTQYSAFSEFSKCFFIFQQ